MSVRPPAGASTRRAAARTPVAWATCLVVVAGLLQATPTPVAAKPRDNEPAVRDTGTPAPARPAPGVRPRRSAPPATAKAPTVAWPQAGVVEVTATHVPGKVSVGGLDVTVSRPVPAAGAAPAGPAPTTPGRVRIETLDRDASQRAGLAGPVLRVAGGAVPARLTVDYRDFAGAYGGDFGARLRLVRLPECALTTPTRPSCAPEPVAAVNDGQKGTLTATVATAGSTLLALDATEKSAQGDYGATALAPAAKWDVAPSSGAFTWNYPVRVPPVPGGQVPSVSLGYNSQTVDGRTTTTNNQGSWVGEGFAYEPGYVERQYKACSEDGHETSADLCWSHGNATMVLNGRSSQLVRDGSGWRLSTDDGSTIVKLGGAANGDNDGEHWQVTTTDGTRYVFGLNRLPGWSTGKEETASVWTVPVFGDDKTNAEDDAQEPCYDATFAKAHCQQAWRWNLDYVEDPHGNVTSYFYEREDNHYALGGKLDVNGTRYHRGGFLERIDYGQRAGAVYTTNAPARVVFATAERCIPVAGLACNPGDLKDSTAQHWQDVPFDRICAAGTRCRAGQLSPSFFTRKRLTGITTQIRSATDWVPVDAWSLEHVFTVNGDGSRTLWLSGITHRGYGGTTTDPLVMPSITLVAQQLPNRIDRPNDNVGELVRPRLGTVYTESGAQIDVTYEQPDCTAGTLPTEGKSTRRCYPVKWHPGGEKDPVTDWFHKYVVREVIETDRTGGSPDMVTRYEYVDDAAWRHAEKSGLSADEGDYLTWSEWRGYATVRVRRGNGQTMTTLSEHTYLRGMDGDRDPDGGTRSVTRKDSVGTEYVDRDELAGFEIETVVRDGDKVVSKSTTKPWRHETASVKHAWGTDRAHFVMPEVTRGFTALEGGGWRETRSVTTYDKSVGRTVQVDDLGDVSTDDDDQCTRTSYADNPGLGIRNLISRVETVAVDCAKTPDRARQVLADERTWYDGKGFGVAPVKGDPTYTEKLASHDGRDPTYVAVASSTFDEYGRPLDVRDGAGTLTTTTYTQVNGLTTAKKQKSPLGHETTTEYAPAWGHPVAQVDPNLKRADMVYDKLGRLWKVWLPDRSKKSQDPNIVYTYSFEKDKPVWVRTETINKSGTYDAEYQIHDGFLRPRQVQAAGPGGGRLVADTFYTPTGKVAKVNDTYYALGAPAGAILPVNNGDVDGQTMFVYDGADRITNEITLTAGDERWRTVTRHGGDRVHVDPPKGATPTTTLTDARGQVLELWQYRGDKPQGAADRTRYTYTAAGKQATVTDPAGNVWRYFYDQRGRRIRAEDPDAGASRFTYDDLDRLVTTTDARDTTLTTTYDVTGRRTAVWQGPAQTGTKLSEWTYDSVAKGQLYAATRFVNGNRFEVRYPSRDALYRVLETQYVIPKAEVGDKLGGVYKFFTAYNTDGTLRSTGFPAAGGMSAESVAYLYDDLQRVTRIEGTTTYATQFAYGQTGELLKADLNTGGRKAWVTAGYERGTKRLVRSGLSRQAVITPGGPPDPTPVSDVDQKYTYDEAGNVLSVEDTPGSGQRDIQCFAHDHLRRMTEAWTSAGTGDEPCKGGAAATGVGGVAPYHHSYTFDAVGNRLTETEHAVGAAAEVRRKYTYPDAGAARPHALSSMTEKTSAGDRLHTYGYDEAGNTTRRTRVGVDQNLSWDAEGHLASVTEAGKTTSFVYTADGERLVRKEPTATTLYLGGMQLRLDTSTDVVDATRFYPVGNGATVVRTVTGLQFQFADRHGTGQAAVDAATGTITHRRTTPYGSPRGNQPGAGQWLGEKGFVGGNQDVGTGLTQLGARLYDPVTGRFISVDPVIDVTDPQQMNAYAYGNNSPLTFTDPDGLRPLITDSAQGDMKYLRENNLRWSRDSHGHWNLVKAGQRPVNVRTPTTPTVPIEVMQARARAEQAKQALIAASKELGKIVMDELGITDALDCVTKGDLGACGETIMNIAESFVGGVVAKIARKYGAPWKWKKAAELGRKLWNLGERIVDGIRTWMKESRLARALGRSACNSFLPGTLVLLANGGRKPIEKLRTGDKVLATDPGTGRTTGRTVVATIVGQGTKNLVSVTVDVDGPAGDRTGTVVATDGHPFWVPELGEWLKATDLRVGQWLRTSAGTLVQVAAVQRWTQTAPVHNLTVDDIHTYYVVAGNTPVLVHNCGEAGLDSAGEAYVRSKHMPGGDRVDETKGVFNADEDLYQLADDSNNFPATRQDGGNCMRVCNAGRVIGREAERDGGMPTNVYTVITDEYGGVITMHPGVRR